MATFRPFRGVRPLPGNVAAVASRPYDVLNSEEARVEAEGNPLSFLHVVKPEIDLPTAFLDKLAKNRAKYPADQVRGSAAEGEHTVGVVE